MGRIGAMHELQHLAAFLMADGCEWLTGQTIALDGAAHLAGSGTFYELRSWSDADWTRAREMIKAQNDRDRSRQ